MTLQVLLQTPNYNNLPSSGQNSLRQISRAIRLTNTVTVYVNDGDLHSGHIHHILSVPSRFFGQYSACISHLSMRVTYLTNLTHLDFLTLPIFC